jgi:hypothetical protein
MNKKRSWSVVLGPALSFFAMVTASPAVADTARAECEAILNALQLSLEPYVFEEGGFFSFDQHRFGPATCVVRSDGSVLRVELPDVVIAEDGFIGRAALSLRDAASEAAARQVAQAETVRDAARREADEAFSAEQLAIEQTLNDFLNSIRRGMPDAELGETLGLANGGVSADALISLSETQTATRTQAVPVKLREVAEHLNSTRTQMQREDFWERAKGRPITINGSVDEIKGSGFLRSASIELALPIRDVSVSCLFDSEDEPSLLTLNVGDEVTCEGDLFSYTFLFDMLHISVDEAELK